ncbi:hypothetical protein AVEN_52251-1 [Araneus ventricosus]|uniref:Uncharacterized protein n=1 Tax=Araneus ventricosus TaxID=182803 RepID=A0A4Y2C159_ARAVE|nr:hypothetical protein AVEN_52251-1 [Araneus ventricosus]
MLECSLINNNAYLLSEEPCRSIKTPYDMQTLNDFHKEFMNSVTVYTLDLEGYSLFELVIFNSCQTTRTTPELASRSQNFLTSPVERRLNHFIFHVMIQRNTQHLLIKRKIPTFANGVLPPRDKIHTDVTEDHYQMKHFRRMNLDIKRAYDSAYIDGHILKCLQLGINGNITTFLQNFVQN